MTKPTNRELAQLLAAWAGVEVRRPSDWGQPEQYKDGELLLMYRIPREDTNAKYGFPVMFWYWDPVNNPNQMELVEDGLRTKGYVYSMMLSETRNVHIWMIWKGDKVQGVAEDPQKKRALALCIWNMGKKP